jgi:hypothetical protein
MNSFNLFFLETMDKLLESDGGGIGAMTDSSVFATPDVSNGANVLNPNLAFAPNDARRPARLGGKKKVVKRKKS